jgi:hypothetical protein
MSLSEQNRALVERMLPRIVDAHFITIGDRTLNALLDAARAEGAPDAEAWRPTHRHVKRGTDYEVVAEGLMQTAVSRGAWDDLPMTIYRGEDGKWWARPTTEFRDGRFEALLQQPTQEKGVNK